MAGVGGGTGTPSPCPPTGHRRGPLGWARVLCHTMKAKGRFLLEGVRENPGQAPPSSGGLWRPLA